MDECARMTCDKQALALLTFSPQDAKAWLYDLEQPDPNGGIMLCRKHANATVVPMSWQLVDARDPAWPGPAGADPISAPAETTVGDLHEVLRLPDLPSDTDVIEEEFAALHADLPVTPRPYAEPQMVTSRAAGRPSVPDLMVSRPVTAPDPSLFELPISDIPAVTPYPGSNFGN